MSLEPQLSRITLILPGLCAALTGSGQSPPSLALLAVRGSGLQRSGEYSPRAALQLWQRDFLEALSLPAEHYASAPLTAYSHGVAAEGTWLHLEPVHMTISVDGLALQPSAAWSASELDALEPLLRPHCEQAGFEWLRTDCEVLLRCADELQADTVAPQAAMLHGLRGSQPQGRDAKRIVQLSTELQMLLHEHPSQQARTRRGELPINALWLWGAGKQQIASRPLPMCWSDLPYVRGLYRACGADCLSISEWPNIMSKKSPALLVAQVIEANENDVNEIERCWFAPLLASLRDGIWQSARVYLDDYYLDVTRGQLRRFWRRPRALEFTA